MPLQTRLHLLLPRQRHHQRPKIFGDPKANHHLLPPLHLLILRLLLPLHRPLRLTPFPPHLPLPLPLPGKLDLRKASLIFGCAIQEVIHVSPHLFQKGKTSKVWDFFGQRATKAIVKLYSEIPKESNQISHAVQRSTIEDRL